MNQFDENSEFVRRKPTGDGTSQTPPAQRGNASSDVRSRTYSGVRPAQNKAQSSGRTLRPIGDVRRPAPSGAGAQRQAPAGSAAGAPSRSASEAKPKNTVQNRKRADKSKNRKTLVRNLLVFVAMFAALLIIGASVTLSSLRSTPEKESKNYTLCYMTAGDEGTEIQSVTVNKVLYMNMTALAEDCGFTVSGSKASLRFTADKGEYVEFTIGNVSAKINGDIVNMEGAALIRDEENVWIPLSFAESYFCGISFDKDEEKRTISISREAASDTSSGNAEYADITFRIKGSAAIQGIDEDPSIGDIETPEFQNDLSAYEQYMNPEDRDAYLILVNKTNTISSDSVPDNLIPIENTRTDRAKEQMVECAEKALEALFIELYSAGYTDVSVTSGYRSYNKQVSLFNTYLQNEMKNNPSLSDAEAKEIVLTYSAFPGTSEHQTGLCCDMHNLSAANVSFANKDAYKWLIENCYKFGFILRFPEDKTEITGYSFEPWHYRFVGRYHATRMHELGMCLEEYTAYLSRVPS